eukprot:TRINITY_DN124_c0_g1_i11.p1 TRINITY_DN124_c0_g1~~TRINITY_DN124_c0_g1_i11.p1  ORF type:complete len:832 (-),score=25.40 TRINITY_DN124_c0_g1_i11:464-2959(-)
MRGCAGPRPLSETAPLHHIPNGTLCSQGTSANVPEPMFPYCVDHLPAISNRAMVQVPRTAAEDRVGRRGREFPSLASEEERSRTTASERDAIPHILEHGPQILGVRVSEIPHVGTTNLGRTPATNDEDTESSRCHPASIEKAVPHSERRLGRPMVPRLQTLGAPCARRAPRSNRHVIYCRDVRGHEDRPPFRRPDGYGSDVRMPLPDRGRMDPIHRLRSRIPRPAIGSLQQILEKESGDKRVVPDDPARGTQPGSSSSERGRGSPHGKAPVGNRHPALHQSVGLEFDTGDKPTGSSAPEPKYLDLWPTKPMATLEAALEDYDYFEYFAEPGVPRARRACYQGVIADSPRSTIDLLGLSVEFPCLIDVLRWVTDVDVLQCYTSDIAGSRGPPNQRLSNHLERLLNLDIAERLPHSAKRRHFCSAFCVKKKAPGSLRFILNPAALNASLKLAPIPRCNLPSYREIREVMMSASWACQFDFQSYYFQIPLAEAVRNLFVFRIGSNLLRMKRAPMGYKCAPAVGQHIAEVLAAAAVRFLSVGTLVWMDNVVFTASSRDVLFVVCSRFRSLCQRFRIVIGDYDEPSQALTAFGIDWDMQNRRFRCKTSWTEKVYSAVDYIDRPVPKRFLWKVCGTLVWRHHALGLPLRFLRDVLHWMSTTSAEGTWEGLCRFNTLIETDVRHHLGVLFANPWVSWPNVRRSSCWVATDASNSGWGVVTSGREFWGSFSVDAQRNSIYVKEMFAACVGLVLTGAQRRTEYHVAIDNKAVIAAFRRGYTFVPLADELLEFIQDWADARFSTIVPHYVQSSANPADEPSRYAPGAHVNGAFLFSSPFSD